MTPVTKYAIIVAAVSIGGATMASALTKVPGPEAGAPGVEQVDRNGHHRGFRRGGGRGGPGGPRGAMEILRLADTDNDGALTKEELDAFLASQVASADADGSGDISLEEFQTIWLTVTQRPMVRSFQMLDTDGDAVVTETEIDERFGKMVERMDRNDDGKLDRADRRGGGKKHMRGPRRERGGERGDD